MAEEKLCSLMDHNVKQASAKKITRSQSVSFPASSMIKPSVFFKAIAHSHNLIYRSSKKNLKLMQQRMILPGA